MALHAQSQAAEANARATVMAAHLPYTKEANDEAFLRGEEARKAVIHTFQAIRTPVSSAGPQA